MDERNDLISEEKTILNKHVIQDKSEKVLFRFQSNSFLTSKKNINFIYPVPKIAIVVEGEARWELGRTMFDVKKDDVIILRPGTIRHFEEIKSDKMLVLDIYEFLPEFLFGMPCMNLFIIESSKDNTVVPHTHPANSTIRETFSHIKEELFASISMGGDMVRGLLMCGLSQIIRALDLNLDLNSIHICNDRIYLPLYDFEYTSNGEVRPLSSTDHSVSMTYVMNMILSNISGEISIDELAEAAHMSRSHFFKVFRKYNGISVNDYILKHRVENTIKRMLESKCNVLEAAYASGFTSSSGFYKAFRKITGKTPKDYLNSIKASWETEDSP